MSSAVNLLALPPGVFDAVLTQENIKGQRSSMNSCNPLSFPKSRAALWDGAPVGEKICLQLFSNRNPRLVLLEKALRLAQRHVRQSDKPHLQCFFLGSMLVDSDEAGVTLTLDRFDPGRDQPGSSGRVPCTVLPGDVVVPCLFVTLGDASEAVVQSESELHHCFKSLQQLLNSRQHPDLCQLVKVRGRISCSQQSDASVFSLSWSSVCPSVGLYVEAVRAVPIIPTALLRSLTSLTRPLPHPTRCQRGYLTMDQTRKLLLLLESDPKACSLPLVGFWLSGVTHVSSPHVWLSCLQFLFCSALLDRVFSDGGSFLLVLFCSTHKNPEFFQCGSSGLGPEPRLDYKLMTAFQCATLYQVRAAEPQNLLCELSSEGGSRQRDVFRRAQLSFSSSNYPAAVCASDQDSGVEDEDLSPRPSPSPHLPAPQVRRIQPSVPELSLLVDSSFSPQDAVGSSAPPPADSSAPPPVDWKSTLSAGKASCSVPPSRPRHPPHHSTPNSNWQQPCSCCASHSCTSIRSSPRLLPAASPQSFQQKSPAPPPPPPSVSSQPKSPPTPPPSVSSQPKSPPPPPPPVSSQQRSPPPPSSSHHNTYLSSSHPHAALSHPPSSNHQSSSSSPLRAFPPLPKYPPSPSTPAGLQPAPPCASSHPGDVPYRCSSCPADAAPLPWVMHPPCVNRYWDQAGAVDTYQLLLQQDQQLRLLQSQVQMLLEAQGKFQPCVETVRSTASVAVGTGTSLFWADPNQPVPAVEAPVYSPETPPPSSSPTCSHRPPSHLSAVRPVDGAEDARVGAQEVHGSAFEDSSNRVQSPVLGESVSMCSPSDHNPNFYKDLMAQLTSRLQEADSRQEDEDLMKRSVSVSPDHSQSSQSSQWKPPPRRKPPPSEDHVVSATLQELRRLGVNVDGEDLSERDRTRRQTVESSSTLASINPAALVSRLSLPEDTFISQLPSVSVDLSLEANAIALRYLSDSQLSRLTAGGHRDHAPSRSSPLSPTNMSVATRKYMRKYGLMEEEPDGDEAEVPERPARQPLTEAQSAELRPQKQLIRDLQPKMQLSTEAVSLDRRDKENRRPSPRKAEGSVGNILDLSRLRQLPKLF